MHYFEINFVVDKKQGNNNYVLHQTTHEYWRWNLKVEVYIFQFNKSILLYFNINIYICIKVSRGY